jgi:hypothetical protein
MLKLLFFGLGLTSVTVLIHGIGVLYVIRRMGRLSKKKDYFAKALGAEMLIIRLIVFLLLLHLAEAAVWAAVYRIGGLLTSIETAMYFSLTSFATLGYGDVVLSGSWRLLGPLEALVGVLMMGWSTGIIVTVILRSYAKRLDVEFANQNKS